MGWYAACHKAPNHLSIFRGNTGRAPSSFPPLLPYANLRRPIAVWCAACHKVIWAGPAG